MADRLFWVSGWIYDFTKVATVFLVVGLVVHYFFFTVLIVRGRSMEPNYVDGQLLVINKISYLVGQPARGDVVAMFFPGETENRFIKRIIGLPGEKVRVTDGKVYINDVQLDQSYLATTVITTPNTERQLQPGQYFVMGDNRSVSSDSRAWGPVPKSFLLGKITTSLAHLPSRLPTAGNP